MREVMRMLYYRDPEDSRTDKIETSDYLFVCSTGLNSVGIHARIHTDYTLLRPEGRHDYHILYMAAGCCHLDYEGETYLLKQGDFALYAPGQAQKYVFYCRDESSYHWVHFKGTGVLDLLAALGIHSGVYRAKESERVRSLFSQLFREFHLKRAGYRPFSASLLSLLLCALARTQEAGDGIEQERRREIYDIAAAISEDPATAQAIDSYAAGMRLSRDRFVHLFKDVMGIPPHRYVQEAKLSLARRLLRESNLPITEIADALGYDDPLYFSRLFRREVGLSPRDYRKNTK